MTTAHISHIGPIEAMWDTGAFRTFIEKWVLPFAMKKIMESWNGPAVECFRLPITPEGTVALTIREGTDVVEVRKVGVVENMSYPMLLDSDLEMPGVLFVAEPGVE